MEFILALIIIIVLCKILGVSNITIIIGGLILIELIIIAMLLLFVYFTLHLIFTKKKKAAFVRTDKPEKSRFKVAYYLVDGEEYPCVFPKEAAFNSIMYKTDREYNVRYSKILKKVYDIWAMLTCIVGLIFSALAVLFTLNLFFAAGIFFE